jgi:hypothetical protein
MLFDKATKRMRMIDFRSMGDGRSAGTQVCWRQREPPTLACQYQVHFSEFPQSQALVPVRAVRAKITQDLPMRHGPPFVQGCRLAHHRLGFPGEPSPVLLERLVHFISRAIIQHDQFNVRMLCPMTLRMASSTYLP